MRALTRHVEQCAACAREYAAMQRTQQLLASLGTKKAPADLALKLRLAISREAAQTRRPRFEGVLVRLRECAERFHGSGDGGTGQRGVDFWTAAGLLCLAGGTAGQQRRRSSHALHRAQLEQSAFGTSLGNMGDDAVVVEAYVDANGRVEDYRILSQPDDAQAVLPQLKNLLIFTTFRPALSMGRPTAEPRCCRSPRSALRDSGQCHATSWHIHFLPLRLTAN